MNINTKSLISSNSGIVVSAALFGLTITFVVHHVLYGDWGFYHLLQGVIVPPVIPVQSIKEILNHNYLTQPQEYLATSLFLTSLLTALVTAYCISKSLSWKNIAERAL